MEYYEYYDYKTTVPRMLGLTMTRVERGNDSNSDTLTFEAENGLTFVQDLFTFLHGEVTEWGTDYAATVLSLAEAERMEAAAKPTPEPPKPAGWVVRGIGTDGAVRFSRGGDRSFATDLRGAYVYESKPLADADAESGGTWRDVVVLPVDAAGNVIEAEDIGATLRREECERKAARQSGVAWEAARAGEEAERLRGELAAVKAERDKVLANAATLDASLRRLRTDHATTLAERDALAAEVQRSREQKPVHLALVNKQGAVVDGYLIKTRALAEEDARRRACTVAPLYLAPVVRDHSGVIAQCEAYLAGDYELGEPRPGPHDVIAAALAALQGAS